MMYAVRVLFSLRKSFPKIVKTSLFKQIRHKFDKTKHTSFDFRAQVKNDVTLFHLENPKFFILINVFSALQCACWTYLGVFLFQEFKKAEIKSEKFWIKVLDGERKYANALGFIVIFYAWAVFLGTVVYTFRSVRKIILNKGGRELTIVTYSFPNFNTITVPISSVSSTLPRIKAKKYIPMKLRNKYFYYLVDVKGQFSNPTLFDYTAGINRGF